MLKGLVMKMGPDRDKSFEYRGFSCEKRENSFFVVYNFAIPGVAEFHPTWEFPRYREVDEELLQNLLFHLGMAESISYWKCVCPRNFYIFGQKLTEEQAAWWKKLFYHGLGEFMFVNHLEMAYDDFVIFHSEGKEAKTYHDRATYSGCLVPVGGGKDSVVTLELLKDETVNTYCVNGNQTTQNVISKCRNLGISYVAKRTLDPEMLALNQKGYLNGHTPFSAIVAFSGFIAAFLCGNQYIALSNEDSANESTVRNSSVNHQYSKTFEFEQDFCRYIAGVTDSDIHYFSMLRPLSELQIAMLFSRCKDYHQVFRSCNVGSKKGIWCCNCAKCLFVYIILCPFLTKQEMVAIFGENLLDKKELEEDFRSLLGLNENKPFECVGTRGEVSAALSEYVKTGKSYLTDRYQEELDGVGIEGYKNHFSDQNHLPKQYLALLKRSLEQ